MASETLGKALGRNIAQARQRKGLTQAQLAERLEVNTETISRFERGFTLPSLETLDRLATTLQVRMGGLLDGVSGSVEEMSEKIRNSLKPLAEKDRHLVTDLISTLAARLAETNETRPSR